MGRRVGRKGGSGPRVQRRARGKPTAARMHGTSRLKAAKCALRAAHLSLPDAHRPLPARSTNWANWWTPTDLSERAFVVAHAATRNQRTLPPTRAPLSAAPDPNPTRPRPASFPRTGSINSPIGCRCRMPAALPSRRFLRLACMEIVCCTLLLSLKRL